MKENRLPSRKLLILWYRLIREILFPWQQWERYRPFSTLTPYKETGTLKSLRWRHKGAVDDLLKKALDAGSFAECDALLAAEETLLVALYCDRIQEITVRVEEFCLRYAQIKTGDDDLEMLLRRTILALLVGNPLPFEN